MSALSSIEWTESTWNPLTGCSKCSPGCKHCYAERMALRLQTAGSPNYKNGFKITMHDHVLNLPLLWRKQKTIFVNSMSDLFHEEVPDEFIYRVFSVMQQAYWHRYQILTKRSERLKQLGRTLPWSPNMWMGVSVENSDYVHRIDYLRYTDAHIKFLSFEPLLGPIPNLNLEEIDWVIVGGESGPMARPMKESWVKEIRDQCQNAGVPFFFKQWGGVNKKKAGRILEGRTWDSMPVG